MRYCVLALDNLREEDENEYMKEAITEVKRPSRGGGRAFTSDQLPNPFRGPEKENNYASLIKRAGEERSRLILEVAAKKAASEEMVTRKMAAIEKQWDKAEHGELPSLNWLADREEGKPMQKTETDVTSGGEKITGLLIEFVKPKTRSS